MKLRFGIVFHIGFYFLAVAATGVFAESNTDLNDQKLAEAATVILQSVKVSPDASRVEIVADRPLTYTFYKTVSPPKAVIESSPDRPRIDILSATGKQGEYQAG